MPSLAEQLRLGSARPTSLNMLDRAVGGDAGVDHAVGPGALCEREAPGRGDSMRARLHDRKAEPRRRRADVAAMPRP